jgi:hypothetical protein
MITVIRIKRYEIALAAIILFMALFRLDGVPPLWWDEGWTLSVARNLVERGHYGRLLNGQPVPPGLEAAFPVTAPIALSFRLLGVGVYQARLVIVLWMLGTMVLLFCVARHLCNRAVALLAVAAAIFLPADHSLHPILMGRQVLGEIPAMFFLLAGFAFMLFLPCQRLLVVLLASFCWALALNTKAQVLPFWAAAMVIPAFATWQAGKRDWTWFFIAALVLSLTGVQLLSLFWRYVLQQPSFGVSTVTGLYEVTAIVTSLPSRLFAVIVLVLFGIPTLVGLCYGLWSFSMDKNWLQTNTRIVEFSIFVLASTWFVWYLVLSVSWIRYLFPASFLGSLFLAKMLYALMSGYTNRSSFRLFDVFHVRGFSQRNCGQLLVVALLAVSFPRTLKMFYESYVRDADRSVQEVASFLNTQTPPGSLIETYDSELFFFLDRPYHYPADQIHVELIRRKFLYDETINISYDPSVANPDYLVVGPHTKQWRLYDSALKTGSFRLIRTYKRYKVYERHGKSESESKLVS